MDLFRQSIYSRLAGYEDTNDEERLAVDPTFRMLASRERRETCVAPTSETINSSLLNTKLVRHTTRG
jgi:hypothetical protein